MIEFKFLQEHFFEKKKSRWEKFGIKGNKKGLKGQNYVYEWIRISSGAKQGWKEKKGVATPVPYTNVTTNRRKEERKIIERKSLSQHYYKFNENHKNEAKEGVEKVNEIKITSI